MMNDENFIHIKQGWCSLFEEPETGVISHKTGYGEIGQRPGRTELSLCQKSLYFGEFEDER